MNCASARNRILALPDPAAVPTVVSDHLTTCAGCAAWHRLLVQVEGAVAAMPVPAGDATARRRLVETFRARPGPKPPTVERAVPTRPGKPAVIVVAGSPIGERLARLWPIGLVAAALLVGALSWVYLGGKPEGPGPAAYPGPDPMLDRVVAANNKIATAETAAARLEGWSDFATAIHEQARHLHKVTPEEMKSLADMYEMVVSDRAIVATARDLSAEERNAVIPRFTKMLVAAEEDARRMAAEAPPASVPELQRIATAAQLSRQKLAQLQQGRDA